MPVENANTIGQLNPLWPLGTDPRGQGDDHIRMLKKTLLALNLDLAQSLAPFRLNTKSTTYGAIGDGTLHTLQEWVDAGKFSGLAGIQLAFPRATALTDSIDWVATQTCLDDAAAMGMSVINPKGRYLMDHTVECLTWIYGEGNLGGWRTVDDDELYTPGGTEWIFIGTGVKDRTIKWVTETRQCGYDRQLLDVDRAYKNDFDKEFLLADFTNRDAVGAAAATAKPFSVAVILGSGVTGISSICSIQNIRVVPNCPGDDEDYGIGGYGVVDRIMPWAHWDIGLWARNPCRFIVRECQIVGYWDLKGFLGTAFATNKSTGEIDIGGGNAEFFLMDRCFVQGGWSFRNGDAWPILSKTESTLTVEWTASHQFAPSGTLSSTKGTWTYTGLVYDGAAKTLTFTGIPSTAKFTLGTINDDYIKPITSGGYANTVISNCEIIGFDHNSRVAPQSPIFGIYQQNFRFAFEVAGCNLRGVEIRGCSIYSREPSLYHLANARDVEFFSCYSEPKTWRKELNGAGQLYGAVMIAGPKASYFAKVPAYERGKIRIYGFTLTTYINRRPESFDDEEGEYRTSGMEDVCNPASFLEDKAFISTNATDMSIYAGAGKYLNLRTRSAAGASKKILRAGPDGSIILGGGYSTVDTVLSGRTTRHEHEANLVEQIRTTGEADHPRAAWEWDLYSGSGNLYFRNCNRADMSDAVNVFAFTPWDGTSLGSRRPGASMGFAAFTLYTDKGDINIEGRTSDSKITMFAYDGIEIGGYSSRVYIRATSGGSGNNYVKMEGPTGGFFYESQYDIRMESCYGGYVRILSDALRIRASSTQFCWFGNVASGNMIGLGPRQDGGYEMRPAANFHQQINLGAADASYKTVFIVNWVGTSDKNAKTKISYEFPEGLLPVWLQIKPALFAYLETPDEMQVGVIAQDIVALFQQNGFDAFEFGIVQENRCEVSERYPDGVMLTVAYSKLLLMEMWANRLRLDRIEKAMGLV